MIKANHHIAGIGLYALAVFAMACMNATAKYLAQWHHPLEITFWRSAVGLVVLAGLVNFRRLEIQTAKAHMAGHIKRGVLGTLAILLAFIAFAHLPLADAIVLIFTSPLFVVGFSAAIAGEPVRSRQIIAIILGFAGVVIVAQPTFAQSPTGLIAGLGSGMCSGLANLYLRNLGQHAATFSIMFWFLVISTSLTAPGMPFVASMPAIELVPAIAGIGLLALTVQLFKTRALARAPADIVAPVFYSMLVWNALFDILIWDRSPPAAVWIGAGIIIGANVLTLRHEGRAGTAG